MSLQALSHNLREIVNTNQQIYDLAMQKKEVLIAGDIEALATLVQRESELIKVISALENGRQQLVNTIIAEYRLTQTEPIRVSDLLAVLPNSEAKTELGQLFDELSKLLSDLGVANQLNQELIENSLQFVNYSIDLFTDPEDDRVYQKPIAHDNGTAPYQRRSIFDTRA